MAFSGKGGYKGDDWRPKGKGFGFSGYDFMPQPEWGPEFGGKTGWSWSLGRQSRWNGGSAHSDLSDGKGFTNVKGSSNGKIWVFCKNASSGCAGKCFLGPNIPRQCNFCREFDTWVVPKKHKHLLNKQQRSRSPASEDKSGQRTPVVAKQQSHILQKFLEENEVAQDKTKELFSKLNFPAPKVKPTSSLDVSLADYKAAQGVVNKISNDLVGKYPRRTKLQNDLEELNDEISALETQLEEANQVVVQEKLKHTQSLGGLAAGPSFHEAAQAHDKSKELMLKAHEHLASLEQAFFSKDDMFGFLQQAMNSFFDEVHAANTTEATSSSSNLDARSKARPKPKVAQHSSDEAPTEDMRDSSKRLRPGFDNPNDEIDHTAQGQEGSEDVIVAESEVPVPERSSPEISLEDLQKSNAARQEELFEAAKAKASEATPS